MTELIIGICILAIMILLHVQGKTIDKQQTQIEVLRETLTEYMFNMTKFVQAQNDANEAVINTLALDEEKGEHYFEATMALAKHVEYIDEELQKCQIAVHSKKGGV
jgi:hypothetical protein